MKKQLLKLLGALSINPAVHEQHPSGALVIAQITTFDCFG